MKSITSPPPTPDLPQAPSRDRRGFPLVLILILGALVTGAVVSAYYIARSELEDLPSSATQPSQTTTARFRGQVRGEERAVVALAAGRVKWMIAEPGDEVRRGQIIAQLDDASLEAQLESIRAQLTVAEQQERQVEIEREALRKDLWDAYLALYPEDVAVDEAVRNADRNIAIAETRLAEATTELNRAKNAIAGANDLDSANPVLDQNQLKRLEQLEAQVRGLEKQLRLARESWVRALSSSLSPYIGSDELSRLRNQWVQVLTKLSDAKQQVFQIRVQQHDVEAQRSALNVVSPVDGIVTRRLVAPEATVQPGQQVVSIAVNLNEIDLEGTILSGAINQLQAGQRVKVFLDLAPSYPLQGRIVAIDPPDLSQSNANITDRNPLMTGIKLHINNPNVVIVPGQSLEGAIVVNPNRSSAEL